MQNIYLYSKDIATHSGVIGVEADDPIHALAKNRGFCFFLYQPGDVEILKTCGPASTTSKLNLATLYGFQSWRNCSDSVL